MLYSQGDRCALSRLLTQQRIFEDKPNNRIGLRKDEGWIRVAGKKEKGVDDASEIVNRDELMKIMKEEPISRAWSENLTAGREKGHEMEERK